MSNSLNIHNKTDLNGSGAYTFAPNRYGPSIRRAMCGIAGIAMAVITIAISVILPAQMDSGSREARVVVASSD